MNVKLLKPVKANGEVIAAGTVIKIDSPEASERMIQEGIGRPVIRDTPPAADVVWRPPHPEGTPEARKESIRLVMEASLQKTMVDIQAGGRWKATPEVRELEDAIDATYIKVITGRGNLKDFISLVAQWMKSGSRQFECPEGGKADA